MFFAIETQPLGEVIRLIRQEPEFPEPLRNFYDVVTATKKAYPVTIITIHPVEIIQVATWIMTHPHHKSIQPLANFASHLMKITRGKENVKS